MQGKLGLANDEYEDDAVSYLRPHFYDEFPSRDLLNNWADCIFQPELLGNFTLFSCLIVSRLFDFQNMEGCIYTGEERWSGARLRCRGS